VRQNGFSFFLGFFLCDFFHAVGEIPAK
jgi:hypothetical protein